MTNDFHHKKIVTATDSSPTVGLVLCIACIAFGVLCFTGEKSTITGACICFIFALLSLCLFIHSVNFRIEYNDEGFTVRNFFRKKRHFSYADITEINMSGSHKSFLLFMGKHHLSVDKARSSHIDFMYFSLQKYQEIYGCDVPQSNRNPFDPTNGQVDNFLPLVFGYGIFFIFTVGFTVEYYFKSSQKSSSDSQLFLLVMSAFILLAFLMLLGSIITGLNPKKYPKLVRLFFKDYLIHTDEEEEP